jgi:hypothetical protein
MRDLIQGILAWRRRFRELRRQRLVDLLNIVCNIIHPSIKGIRTFEQRVGPSAPPPASLFTPKNKFPTIFKL